MLGLVRVREMLLRAFRRIAHICAFIPIRVLNLRRMRNLRRALESEAGSKLEANVESEAIAELEAKTHLYG